MSAARVSGVDYDVKTGIRVDNFLRTRNPRIFAADDVCLEHAFTNTAEASARIVERNALFRGRQRMSALTAPWCTYTDPQVAHVGLAVRQAAQACAQSLAAGVRATKEETT